MIEASLIIGIIIIIIIILLITNYIRINQIAALESSNPVENFIKDFSSMIQLPTNQKDKLVLYYTNWCGISQQFKPIWDQFCKETKTNIITEEINCENDENKCKLMNIKGYPTVILQKCDGTNIEFNSQRTVQNLEDFVNKNIMK